MKTNIIPLLLVGAICGVGMGIGIEKMRSQDAIDYTLEKNAEIMDTVIAVNSRIYAIQDDLWRVGHYINKNHGKGRKLCPECAGAPQVTTQDGIDIAEELPPEEFPDTMETVLENSDELLTMIKNIHTTLFSLKITNDIILQNVREANVETN